MTTRSHLIKDNRGRTLVGKVGITSAAGERFAAFRYIDRGSHTTISIPLAKIPTAFMGRHVQGLRNREPPFEIELGLYDTRWDEQVLLMAGHLTSKKIPYDSALKIINEVLDKDGDTPLTYAELGQIYTRAFFAMPKGSLYKGDQGSGEMLAPDTQDELDEKIRAYFSSQDKSSLVMRMNEQSLLMQ